MSQAAQPRPDLDQHMVALYHDLRKSVRQRMHKCERPGHTLSPTDVVNEAYLRLSQRNQSWASKTHIQALAVKCAWDVLVDYARKRNAEKRGGQQQRVTLLDGDLVSKELSLDVLDLYAALEKLEEKRPQQRKVVDLRFFGGMSFREIGDFLYISPSTAREYWAYARAWLMSELRTPGVECDRP